MSTFDSSLDYTEELAAVNDILAAIGESPVTSLDEDANADVANARRILNKVNRQIQSKGWTFNIDEGVSLIPDVTTNLIPFVQSYLSVLATSGTTSYVNRRGYLYDRTSRTDQFSSPVTVNLIRLRNFEEMPECFRHWIVTKAARQFNSRFFGAQDVDLMLQQEEDEAVRDCFEYELDYGRYNMLDGDTFTSGLLSR